MTTDMHRERANRQPVNMALIYDRGDRYVAANLLDISETGVLLAGDETAAVGEQVTLYADLNDHQSWPIHIEGLVVRHADGNQMGVRFMYASVSQLAQMRLFVQAVGEQPVPVAVADGDRTDASTVHEKKRDGDDDAASDKGKDAADADEEEKTPEGEPTLESLSDAERKKELDEENEAAEGESLDTVDAHEAARADEREAKAEEKEKAKGTGALQDTPKKSLAAPVMAPLDFPITVMAPPVPAPQNETLRVDVTSSDDGSDDSMHELKVDRRAWTTLTSNALPMPGDDVSYAFESEFAVASDAATSAELTARRERTTKVLVEAADADHRSRAMRASLNGVYGVLDLAEHFSAGAIVDLSETGFFLATDRDVELGQDLTFMPHDEDDEVLPFELQARVVRIQEAMPELNRPRGIGCRLHIGVNEREALKTYLRRKLAN